MFSVNILAAADEVLIPIQTEFYAMDGVAQLLEVVKLVQDNLNASLKVGTVLLTMYDGRKLSADHTMQVKEKHYEKVGEDIEQIMQSYQKNHPAWVEGW